MRPAIFFLVMLCLGSLRFPVLAYPSGGPYGPVQRTYAVPADAAHVYFVATNGNPEASGKGIEAPTTLESAIARVVSDDVIVLRGGTYRTGGLVVNQGMTLQPYADERVILKGTRVATGWVGLRGSVWRADWPALFPEKPADWWRRDREGMRTPLHRFNNDMVFVDGRPLQSAGWEGGLDSNSFAIDYDSRKVFIGINPEPHLVEITAFDSALVRTNGEVHGKKPDGKGLVVRGLTFTQYAYRAVEVLGAEPEGVADASTFGKDVVGSLFENVTFSHCSRVAGYFRGDRTVFRNCLVSDTSTEGLYIIASSDCLLERNIFARNNVEGITGYYPAAVKIFNQTRRVVCRDNVVIDQPQSNGIWYDVGNQDGVFVDNWVEGCLDGFFFEISKGVVCAGNVFVNCDKGLRVLNSANARVYHNTFVNAVASFERDGRSAEGDHFGWHPSTGPGVDEREGHVFVGNLLAGDEGFRKPLLRFEQSRSLCGRLTNSPAVKLDYNLYVRGGDSAGLPLLVWAPVSGNSCVAEMASLEELRQLHPDFEAHSRCLAGHYGSVFNSPELKNFTLRPGLGLASPVPPLLPDIEKLVGRAASKGGVPGAYPASGLEIRGNAQAAAAAVPGS